MQPTLTYPGVYIEEAPSSVHPITAVATSITAFVGRALRGPVDQAVTITSFSDFERVFGGVWLESNLGYAVQDFYRNGGSTAVVVRVHKTKANDTAAISLGSSNRQVGLAAASPGAWGAKLTATIDDDVADPSDTTSFNLTVTDTGTGKVEVFRNVSFATASPQRYDKVLANQSTLVVATGSLPTQPQSSFPVTANATGGNDGNPVDASLYTGGTLQADKKGLYALENTDLVNIIVIPPYTSTGEIDSSVLTDTIAYAVERRAMMIVDPPVAWASLANAVTGAGTFTASPNAAVYFPQIQESDPLHQGLLVTVAPSGAIAGILARTDATRGVWKAPAGLEATVNGALGLSDPTDRRRERRAQPARRQLPAHALRAPARESGARAPLRAPTGSRRSGSTCRSAGRRSSSRRASTAARSGSSSSPTTSRCGRRSGSTSAPSCTTLFRQGAFQGTTPREAYFVKCDAETTTPGRHRPRHRQHRGRLRTAASPPNSWSS